MIPTHAWLKGPRGTKEYTATWLPDRAAEAQWDVVVLWAAVEAAGGSPTKASLAVGLGTLLLVVSAPLGGALADHLTLQRTAAWTLLVRALLFALLFGAMIQGVHWWVIALLVGAMSLLDGAHFPALSGLGRLLTARGDTEGTTQVTAARESAGNLARIGGTAIAGLLIGWHAPTAALLGVLLVLLAGVMLTRLTRILDEHPAESAPSIDRVSGPGPAFGSSWPVVWSLVTSSRAHLVRLLMFAASNACTTGPLLLAIPLMSRDYAWPWWGIALTFSVNAIGALAGAIALNRHGHRIASRLRFGLLVLLPGVAGMTIVATGHVPVLVALGLLIAAPAFAVNAMLMESDLRAATPDSAQGAMGALQDICIFGVGPLGQIAFGLLASATSLKVAGLAFAAAMLVAICVVLSLTRAAHERKPSVHQLQQ